MQRGERNSTSTNAGCPLRCPIRERGGRCTILDCHTEPIRLVRHGKGYLALLVSYNGRFWNRLPPCDDFPVTSRRRCHTGEGGSSPPKCSQEYRPCRRVPIQFPSLPFRWETYRRDPDDSDVVILSVLKYCKPSFWGCFGWIRYYSVPTRQFESGDARSLFPFPRKHSLTKTLIGILY